jgi:phosphate transport system protein
MPEITRRTFHQELEDVQREIVRLAALVIESISRGTEILLAADLKGAEDLIEGDDELDALDLEIQERCYRLLALQQPMASDLRAIVTAIRLTSEIERSGDLMVNVAKATRRIYGSEIDPKVRGLIQRMGEEAHRLFGLAIDAYARCDDGIASALDDIDDRLDTLHADYIQSIFEANRVSSLDVQVAVQLALVGRYYERIGDHAVNIGQRVHYMITGWLPEHTGAARAAARRSGREAGGDAAGSDGADGDAGSGD